MEVKVPNSDVNALVCIFVAFCQILFFFPHSHVVVLLLSIA